MLADLAIFSYNKNMKKYLTTAIPYLNGAPHIGHAMDYLLADVCARYWRLCGDEVRFQAGTDEHGNKVAKKAVAAGVSPQEFVDHNAQIFQDFIRKLDVTNTDFIRTTDPDHERRCQAIWEKLAPHIYKDTYHGWYCEGCERFVTEKEVEENDGICPDHQAAYVELDEENYYLRIADFKPEIAEAIKSGRMQILPEFRAKEALAMLIDAPDVSISRPREHLTWGVPVPGDDTQVMYVWIDALANYITVLGYPDATGDDLTLGGWWPASAQFIGKDVLRFHAIIWPAMLLALGLELPRTIVSHGLILVDGQKISKSLGNSIDPQAAIDRWGLPAFRYYFLRHIDTFADSDFTWEKFDAAYADELANDYGNLVQRLATLAHRNDIALAEAPALTLPATYCTLMDEFKFSKGFDYAWERLQQLNRDINEAQPWTLAKNGEQTELQQVMRRLIGDLLAANHLLKPFLPTTAAQVEAIFTAPAITPPKQPLFPKN